MSYDGPNPLVANAGGTGVANLAASTITLGGSLTTLGAFNSTFTMTGTTGVTFPTSGTLATTSQLTSGTVTSVSVVSANGFAGSVATATTTPAITLTTTATGVLSGNGTSISGSAVTQYDVLVGGASNAISSIGPGSSGQVLQSGGNAANPAYSTATYPATATGTGTILRADGTNWSASTNTFPNTSATGSILYASGTNVIGNLADVATGQVLTSGGVGVAPAYSATPTVTSITFGAGTALNAYVQGTFTPTLTFGGGSTGITYSTQAGEYTKVGNIVFYTFSITLTSKGSSTGGADIATPVNTGGSAVGIFSMGYMSNITLDSGYTTIGGYTQSNFIILQEMGSGQAVSAVTNSHFANNSTIVGGGHYFTS